ncbi:hypothetical protein Godav_029047 [Gossypium davidsonii]|nr:hypothetical protein [Gossypium davidsonii]
MAKGLEIEFEALLTSWMVIDFSNNKFLNHLVNFNHLLS